MLGLMWSRAHHCRTSCKEAYYSLYYLPCPVIYCHCRSCTPSPLMFIIILMEQFAVHAIPMSVEGCCLALTDSFTLWLIMVPAIMLWSSTPHYYIEFGLTRHRCLARLLIRPLWLVRFVHCGHWSRRLNRWNDVEFDVFGPPTKNWLMLMLKYLRKRCSNIYVSSQARRKNVIRNQL